MQKLFKIGDLYYALFWLVRKTFYSVIPIQILFLSWNVRGFVLSLVSKERFIVKRNLASLMGHTKSEKEIRLTARRYFKYLSAHEPIRIVPKLRGFSGCDLLQVEGLHNLVDALSRGKGVILISAHFGHISLLRYILETKGYTVRRLRARNSKRMKLVTQKRKQRRKFSRFQSLIYDRLCIEPAAFEEDDLIAALNVRPTVKALTKNEIILILGDALHASNFVNLTILGQTYPFPTGFMNMALSTGSSVLPTFAVDHDNGLGVKIVIHQPLALRMNGKSRQQLIETNLEQYVRIFDSYVRQYPHLMKIWTKENWFQKRLARSQRELAKRY